MVFVIAAYKYLFVLALLVEIIGFFFCFLLISVKNPFLVNYFNKDGGKLN